MITGFVVVAATMFLGQWSACKHLSAVLTLIVYLKATHQLHAFPKFGRILRLVESCLFSLRYFLVVLAALIIGFGVSFMLLFGAFEGERQRIYIGNPNFDIADLPVSISDTFSSESI